MVFIDFSKKSWTIVHDFHQIFQESWTIVRALKLYRGRLLKGWDFDSTNEVFSSAGRVHLKFSSEGRCTPEILISGQGAPEILIRGQVYP